MSKDRLPSDEHRSRQFGSLLVLHRRRHGLSQMAFALEAGVSVRHLGFLEVGRSRPSVDMVRRLSGALGLASAERQSLLLAAGYAPDVDTIRGESHRAGETAFEAAMALGRAQTAAAAVEVAAEAFANLGVEHFISGLIRRNANGFAVERDIIGRPAVGWLQHMHLRRYHERDYLPAAAFARTRGFFWSELVDADMNPAQRRIFEEARDFKIAKGFVLPIHQPDGTVRALASWAEKLDECAVTRTSLSLVASALLDALDTVGIERDVWRPERLSADHREILLRVLEGDPTRLECAKSTVPIADLLVSASSVMGMRCIVSAAGRASALGLLD